MRAPNLPLPRMLAILCPLLLLSQGTPPGLVHRWTLAPDSHAGAQLRDSVGDWDLDDMHPPEFRGEGAKGAALVGPGRGGGERRVAADQLPAERFTAEGWMLIQKKTPYAVCVAAIEDNGDHERGFLLGTQNERFVFAVASVGLGKLSFVRAPDAFELNRWYHLAGVYDGEALSLYVDGVEVAVSEQPAGSIQYDDSHLLTVGVYRDKDETYPLSGLLAGVGLYDRAIRGRDIARSAESGRPDLPTPEVKVSADKPIDKLGVQVNAAIGKGLQWLLLRQHRDGSWGDHMGRYRNGQTALALLTLLKSGVLPNHPSVVRGFEFLEREDPRRTYAAGCQLLAIAATGNKDYEPMAERVAELLLEWESSRIPGSWAYPEGAEDLSCTQFAAMGLWAASEMGIKIPKAVWQRMVETTIEHFGGDASMIEGEGKKRDQAVAKGFVYHQASGVTTGSMTAAGLGIFEFATVSTGGKLGARFNKMIERNREPAMNWLRKEWRVNGNPGRGGTPHYFLYGLERLGSLMQTADLVGHDWYGEGAKFLVGGQGGDGSWGGESDTCFALLFLVRATGPTTGGKGGPARREWGSDEGSVHAQVFGDLELTMFVTGFDDKVLREHREQEAKKAGLRIAKVEWKIDGKIVDTKKVDPGKAWKAERFPLRWTAPREMDVSIQVSVHAVPVGDYADSYANTTVYTSKPLTVPVRRAPLEFAEQLGQQDWTDLLDGRPTIATASSQLLPASGPDKAIDNLEATSWLSAADDAAPWLRVEIEDALKVSEVKLGSPNSSIHLAATQGSPTRVRIVINKGRVDFEADLPEDDLLPAIIRLPRRTSMRSIEVHILERRPGPQQGVVGISELSVR